MKTGISSKSGKSPGRPKVISTIRSRTEPKFHKWTKGDAIIKAKIPSGGTVTININDLMAGRELDTTTMDTIITSGFGACTVYAVKSALDLKNSYLAKTMGMSEKTLQRRCEANKKLSPIESDRLYRVIRIYSLATRALEDADAARKWLTRPQRGLGNRIPIDMIQTEAGTKEVENLLGQIEYGVIS